MARGEGFAENLREKLALAIRSIEWSYAIFWTISSVQPGVLEWGDGYYNGDIKTRKTVQAAETSTDQLGLQRTEHLRELYGSLLSGEMNMHARIPSAALSPEDLTDTEWYFLVCMSFVFNVGQGLPGKAFAKNKTIWLCNAPQADGRVFTRTLLAKSASIQTVVCFPHLGGIIELGVTELVKEDLSLIQHLKTSYLDIACPIVPGVPNYISTDDRNDRDIVNSNPNQDALDASPKEENIDSPDNSSDGLGADQQAGDEFKVKGTAAEASQLPNCEIVEDDISNCIHNSTNSSDCISQNYENTEKVSNVLNDEELMKHSPLEHQECNQENLVPSDYRGQGHDVHYQSILSSVLKSSHQFILGPYYRNTDSESSFVSWKKEISSNIQMPRSGTSQRLLKKLLSGVARMVCIPDTRKESDGKNDPCRLEADENDRSRVVSERRRREKINERFMILASLIPSSGKVDKVSILDETIEYLKDLKTRVWEAESQKEGFELNARMRRNCEDCDDTERTSDNCGTNIVDNSKKSLPKKRKACETGGVSKGTTKNGSARDVIVSVSDEDVTVEIGCQSSEGVLIKIIQALKNLHLDCETIQSSNSDNGILSVTVKCKMKASELSSPSPALIRQALKRVI
uniref:Putative anthocyanin regulator n=1 Tax=Operculina pteripes TaxID=197425 RepID=A9YF11_9ASTE|nr:putative anthocyanin regulator [Operculina pteripes]